MNCPHFTGSRHLDVKAELSVTAPEGEVRGHEIQRNQLKRLKPRLVTQRDQLQRHKPDGRVRPASNRITTEAHKTSRETVVLVLSTLRTSEPALETANNAVTQCHCFAAAVTACLTILS